MADVDTGGSAFPTQDLGYQDGMTIRDLFAGMAMQGAMNSLYAAHVQSGRDDGPMHETISIVAYKIADAMIAEMRRTEGTST